ncbi:hypothetical protein [Frankia sp. QA3]|uniref:hypothetical protein n=1 Tax=Frankia sp. QA3 TaxID=710111 RepID=UPI001E588C43|nr:hypothetical protein [Frankia sp. QA3]
MVEDVLLDGDEQVRDVVGPHAGGGRMMRPVRGAVVGLGAVVPRWRGDWWL